MVDTEQEITLDSLNERITALEKSVVIALTMIERGEQLNIELARHTNHIADESLSTMSTMLDAMTAVVKHIKAISQEQQPPPSKSTPIM
jgi:hypothetical protein